MKYINLKYIGNGAKRTSDIGMGGFELEATTKIETLKATYRKGQLCKEFKLMIPPDGACKVPDTQFNREILRIHCSARKQDLREPTMINGKPKMIDGEVIIKTVEKKFIATYELLSKIDLEEDSPNKPEIVYTQKELDKIVLEQSKGKLTQKDVEKAVTESTKGTFTQEEVDVMIAKKVAEATGRVPEGAGSQKSDAPDADVKDDADLTEAEQTEGMKKNRFANKSGAPDLA